ncbi:MAG: glycosyltransferase [Lachnospiraceae bacterium]|nr:glycosyltransferase [Lachnospiraceae bacterium]
MNRKICFITTGDIKNIATSKRALGLANPLTKLGWDVSIIMEDTEENRSRVHMECNNQIDVLYLLYSNANDERKKKAKLLKEINPDVVYICAFVFRNIISTPRNCIRLVEHSELQSEIADVRGVHKIRAYIQEYYSIVYSTGLLNASRYLENVFRKRARWCLKGNMPMLYSPYAYNKDVCTIDENASRLLKKKDEERFFVFLGSLALNYGAMTMVKAFEKISKSMPNIKLLLCGRGSAFKHVCEYIKVHHLEETVYTPGYIKEEDIPGYFTLADGFISPMNDSVQDWARCPSKLYMYLPYKKPIVTCRIGEPYETLGDKGYYFTPSDANSLAETVMKIAEQNKWKLDIDPSLHEWNSRAQELDRWIKSQFKCQL